MEELQIFNCDSPGFTSLVGNAEWSVGIVNYSDQLNPSCLKKRERHLLTDELFILIQGEAHLYIGVEMCKYPLEIGKAYLVKKGIWHAISISIDAKIFVVENAGTGMDNTEYYYFSE